MDGYYMHGLTGLSRVHSRVQGGASHETLVASSSPESSFFNFLLGALANRQWWCQGHRFYLAWGF
jgi:hypothetical protein